MALLKKQKRKTNSRFWRSQQYKFPFNSSLIAANRRAALWSPLPCCTFIQEIGCHCRTVAAAASGPNVKPLSSQAPSKLENETGFLPSMTFMFQTCEGKMRGCHVIIQSKSHPMMIHGGTWSAHPRTHPAVTGRVSAAPSIYPGAPHEVANSSRICHDEILSSAQRSER